MVKLLDYRGREDALAASDNPFTFAVEAHLAAQATQGDPSGRLASKLALTRRLFRHGLSRRDVVNLYAFVDWLLVLPEALETAYLEDIQQLEEEIKMRYVTSAERIGIRKGIELGREKGRQEGMQESRREMLEHLLVVRFGPLPEVLTARLVEAESAQLSAWFERALTADSLEAVFAAA